MSGGGGGYGAMIRSVYDQLPGNLGGAGPSPGAQQQPPQPPAQGGVGGQYGQLGSYNTLAQDLSAGRTGGFQFGGGQPFGYMPGQGPGGRPGVSGYTGIGPFQNQGGGQIPQGYQSSMGLGSWPGFGQGGMPGFGGPGAYYGGQGGGYFGGSGFGMQGPPQMYGPGSYSSPGSMPYGGGSGMGGGFGGFTSPFMQRARQQGAAQDLRARTSPFGVVGRTPGTPTGIRIPQRANPMLSMPPQGQGGGLNPQTGKPFYSNGDTELAQTGGSPNPFLSFPGTGGPWGSGGPRSVAPAQAVQQYLNYRSPFSGGGGGTQYGPQMQQITMPQLSPFGGAMNY